MRKIALMFLMGAGLLFSCQKEEKDPVLDMSQTQKPVIIDPVDGSSLELTLAEADSIVAIDWTATQYNLAELETIKYILQMDSAGNNFADPVEIVVTTSTLYETTVGNINNKLILEGFSPGAPGTAEYRVISYLNTHSDYSRVVSDPISVTFTTYNTIVYVKPIYLLGDATTVLWDNANALEMTHLIDGQFAIVATLNGSGKYIKFISVLGQWAPQWGTDDTGTNESGPLVYRPTEDVPDPAAIPSPDVPGDYYILADTANLQYSVSATSAQLFLVGDATEAGWDNTAGIPFIKEAPGIFSLVTNLVADAGMKLLEVSGQWAPQWGTDAEGTGESGNLVYRPTESVPDPPEIPSPSSDGSYLIQVNLITKTYMFTKQ